MISQRLKHHQKIKNLFISLAVGCVLGLLGVFGMDAFPLHISILYWSITCAVGWLIYSPLIALVNAKCETFISKEWLRIAIGALLGSVLMAFAVPVISWAFFANELQFLGRFLNIFPKTCLIGGIITFFALIREIFDTQKQQLIASMQALEASKHAEQEVSNKPYEDFIKQIPLEKRGDLYCLEMSDHYVKVYTSKGHHMLLMRFKDALQALESYSGLQTHRSWWVATSAIEKVTRSNRKLVLMLKNGLTVPVSKTYAEQVKEAGFRH